MEKIIEFLKSKEAYKQYFAGNPKLTEAVENLIKGYKELEEENKELLEVRVSASAHNRIMELEEENAKLKDEGIQKWLKQAKDSIPKSLINEKIEELDEELEIMKVDNMYGRYKEYGGKLKWEKLFARKYGMHDVLEELLKGEEK